MENKLNKRVLVIGGAGYIGTVVSDHLLKAGYAVSCLDNLMYQNNLCVIPLMENQNYNFIYGDLRNKDDIDRALKGVTDVVLLAGLVGDPITKKYPEVSAAINGEGVISCIDNLNKRGLDRVIFISTCSNYGLIKSNQIADENFELTPLSLYAKSKVEAERYLLSIRNKIDFSPTILRFATAFGLAPRMRFDLTVNEFTRELALEKELLIFDAETWRPYCHVKDFARLIQKVLEAPSEKVRFEIFNAGGEINNFTKQGIVNVIKKFLPSAKIRYQENGSDPRNYRVDFSKVREVLKFEPEYLVEDGVIELLNAINEHVFDRADLMKSFHGNYEIDYKLT